ncbi:MAG: sulfatase [Acidobacteria bacterium]|nr:sulfatase [Acidobacteriota bacterium]
MHSFLSRRVFVGSLLAADPRPNLLLLLADNWAYPHAGVYADPAVKTPTFDGLAREGMLFTHAFAPNPSCSPSRSMLLTGQETHRLGAAANLYGPLPEGVATYPALLEKAGYFVGYSGKGWGPGKTKNGNPAGRVFESFAAFLAARPKDRPFCFWFGSHDPHVPWDRGSRAGIALTAIRPPAHLPDDPVVREDIRGYYAEVQQFDSECGEILGELKRTGELDRTLVAMTGDNGWQIPRGLANCYDLGVRVPLALRWPGRVKTGARHEGFVTLGDLCPTFLEAAGVPVPRDATAKSLLRPPLREEVFLERERHANVRRGDLSYPVRGVRTREYLYLRNLEPERWPAGDPELYWAVGEYGDVDESATKRLVMDLAESEAFRLCFAKRPVEELYDCGSDQGQVKNLAGDRRYAAVRRKLAARVDRWMRETGDPRAKGPADYWDRMPYTGPKRSRLD